MQKSVTLAITGMHCTSCAMNIDGELEDAAGVEIAQTSYAKQESDIVFNSEKISVDEIIKIINSVDDMYSAELK